MNKNNLLVVNFLLTGFSLYHSTAHTNPFKHFREQFEQLEQAFNDHFESSKSLNSKVAHVQMTQDPESKLVRFTVTHFKTDKIDTEVNRKGTTLVINADHAQISLHARNKYVSVAIEGKTEVDRSESSSKEQSETKEKSTFKQESYFSSSFAQMLDNPINLKNAAVEYVKDTETLTLSVPYFEDETTKIPVKIK